MIDEKSNLTTIDALIQRKQPFAVYRVPGEKYPRLLTEDVGAVRLIFRFERTEWTKRICDCSVPYR